jgi:hypothetical protein
VTQGRVSKRPASLDAYIEIRMINTIEWVLDFWPTLDERPWGRAFLQRAGEFFGD